MDYVKGIYALLTFSFILFGINQSFTNHYIIASIIEVAFIFLLIYFFTKQEEKRKKEKNKYCDHKNLKGSCIECAIRAENIKKGEEVRSNMYRIKNLTDKTIKEESYKIANLRLKNSSNLLSLSPNEFEDAIAKLYETLGYTVQQTPYTNDGGKDAIAWKNNIKYVIECKRYAVDKGIGRPMLQKFHSAMMDEKAEKGFFVTTSYFTDTAIAYSQKFNIELVDNKKLITMMELAYPNINNDFYFIQICSECGSSVKFQLNNENINLFECNNGHMVKKSIPFIQPQTVYKKKYPKRYRRY